MQKKYYISSNAKLFINNKLEGLICFLNEKAKNLEPVIFVTSTSVPNTVSSHLLVCILGIFNSLFILIFFLTN